MEEDTTPAYDTWLDTGYDDARERGERRLGPLLGQRVERLVELRLDAESCGPVYDFAVGAPLQVGAAG